jgi:quercetin dioxygenase-like cupin family protein
MTVIRSASAPVFEQPGTVVTGLASPSRGSREISAWRLRLEPGAASPDHTLTHEEVFVALSGAATATLDGTEHPVAAGDALVVSPGVPFRIAAAGDEGFEAVACMRCGGLARVGADTFPPPWAE